jgi:hypothetical protein
VQLVEGPFDDDKKVNDCKACGLMLCHSGFRNI